MPQVARARVLAPSPTLLALLGCSALALALACATPPQAPQAQDHTRRQTRSGELVGFTGMYGSHVWLGVPYAAPPVGALRWRAPQPPPSWQGARPALQAGAICPQFASPLGSGDEEVSGQVVGAEDCLFLNIYAPPFNAGELPRGEERRPVMVWIHGGGNTLGQAALYDGGHLAARHGVIVVTVNYRLGVLGWFRHAALRQGADALDASGNFGTLDLIQALRWVRDNIGAFGGDPGRVTVFGESAGGANVYSLLLSPQAKGLFHRAIAQSGVIYSSSLVEAEALADAPEPGHRRSSAELLSALMIRDGSAQDRAAALERQLKMSAQELASYLRGKPAAELLQVFEDELLLGMYRLPLQFRDGAVMLAEEPYACFARPGCFNQVPLLLGTNRDESKLFQFYDPSLVELRFGFMPQLRDPEGYDVRAEYVSQAWRADAVDAVAARITAAGWPEVYAYRFDWDEEPAVMGLDLGQLIGAAHGFEIPFVFGHWQLGPDSDSLFTEENRAGREALSETMMAYWTEHAFAGDPGRGRDGQRPRWSRWGDGPGGEAYILLDTEAGGGVRMAAGALTRERLLERLDADERLLSRSRRCALVDAMTRWSKRFTAKDYEARCQGYPRR